MEFDLWLSWSHNDSDLNLLARNFGSVYKNNANLLKKVSVGLK